MKTFRNKNFIRNYECTNIVFCIGAAAPNENWIECDNSEIEKNKCNQVYIENNVKYFGYL